MFNLNTNLTFSVEIKQIDYKKIIKNESLLSIFTALLFIMPAHYLVLRKYVSRD